MAGEIWKWTAQVSMQADTLLVRLEAHHLGVVSSIPPAELPNRRFSAWTCPHTSTAGGGGGHQQHTGQRNNNNNKQEQQQQQQQQQHQGGLWLWLVGLLSAIERRSSHKGSAWVDNEGQNPSMWDRWILMKLSNHWSKGVLKLETWACVEILKKPPGYQHNWCPDICTWSSRLLPRYSIARQLKLPCQRSPAHKSFPKFGVCEGTQRLRLSESCGQTSPFMVLKVLQSDSLLMWQKSLCKSRCLRNSKSVLWSIQLVPKAPKRVPTFFPNHFHPPTTRGYPSIHRTQQVASWAKWKNLAKPWGCPVEQNIANISASSSNNVVFYKDIYIYMWFFECPLWKPKR